MVTAETAMSLPVLVLLTMVGVAAVGIGQARLRCVDAAGEAARAVARGDPGSAAARAQAAAGRPVTLSIGSAASDTRVTVRMALRPVRWLPAVLITESAVAATEPGASS
ncbi:MAG TPA: TadE family type IV pilus minor pilin [Jatrophihabitans sp.]